MQRQNRNNSNSQQIKKEKAKPEWSTDFVDREQYKLSQVQRIQKKASLQSKNREEARRQLEQRRKKLQLGIIDEQTKKIYQTALVSKNIDVNPTLRKNLTEMIKYEKQQRQKTIYQNQNYNDQENEEDLNDQDQQKKELRDAQNFIKKFQKAKKQQKIERAVEILNSNQSLENWPRAIQAKEPETKINNFMSNYYQSNTGKYRSKTNDQKGLNRSNIQSQDEAISSIEDTIRFMQEKLFLAKKTVDEHSKSFISNSNESFEHVNPTNQIQDKYSRISSTSKVTKLERPNQQLIDSKLYSQLNLASNEDLDFCNKIGQISQLKIKLKNFDEAQSDEQCLETIRRMRQILQNKVSDEENYENRRMKQNIQDNFISSNVGIIGFHSTISKKSLHFGTDSEAEVSFNLTLNDQEFQQNFLRPNNNQKKKETLKEERYQNEYKNVKQNLFSCISSEPLSSISKDNEGQRNINVELCSEKFTPDSDDGQPSEDSLMIRNKINLWKKEFQHQADRQDNDAKQKRRYCQIKEEDLPKKTDFISYEDDKKQSKLFKRHDEEHNSNRYSRQVIENIKDRSQNRQNEQNNQKAKENTTNKTTLKKPPLVKKMQNDNKFEEMKRMISDASTSIKKLEIEPLKIESLGAKEVMGFDFRGSINIKKNIK